MNLQAVKERRRLRVIASKKIIAKKLFRKNLKSLIREINSKLRTILQYGFSEEVTISIYGPESSLADKDSWIGYHSWNKIKQCMIDDRLNPIHFESVNAYLRDIINAKQAENNEDWRIVSGGIVRQRSSEYRSSAYRLNFVISFEPPPPYFEK